MSCKWLNFVKNRVSYVFNGGLGIKSKKFGDGFK